MIHVIIGTKAQLIKMAPLLKYFNEHGIAYNYISTGQHKATIDEILENFGIRPADQELYRGKDITSVPQMLGWSLRLMIKAFFRRRQIFLGDKEGIVLVHGDTFSTLLGAILGKIAGLKVGHVESGLRSFNWLHPFPEELTRVLTFKLTDYFFCPGKVALGNVQNERGVKVDTQVNTLYDALQIALPTLERIADVEIPEYAYGVVTLHRYENICSRAAMERIVGLVERISIHSSLLFILHKPTLRSLQKFGLYTRLVNNPRIELRPRYDYFRFIKLISKARFVVSDGGSNQEECYYLGMPVLLLRKHTERREGLGENCVLSGYDEAVVDAFAADPERYRFDCQKLMQTPCAIIADHCRPFSAEE